MDKEISACLLKLRRSHPFFASIALFAKYEFTPDIKTIGTDGETIFINKEYFLAKPAEHRVSVLLHQLLHTALQHALRCGEREPQLWNTAADIVVNNIILELKTLQPPEGTAVDPRFMDHSVEQVYEKLMVNRPQCAGHGMSQPQQAQGDNKESTAEAGKAAANQTGQEQCQNQQQNQSAANDKANKALGQKPCGKNSTELQNSATANMENNGNQKTIAGSVQIVKCENKQYLVAMDLLDDLSNTTDFRNQHTSINEHRRQQLSSYWKSALARAKLIEDLKEKHQGLIPTGLLREFNALQAPQIDWRTLLWRYMTPTPCDFRGFDRRFIHQGLYLENLEGESVTIYIAIDTSGSINRDELTRFISEVDAVLRSYPHVRCKIYYVDAEVHGPYEIDRSMDIAHPVGGGGTDFRVFFQALEKETLEANAMCIYFTDGFGEFPNQAPEIPVMWVVSQGGLETEEYPFGDVARLATN